jgi:hypothetical protein
MDYIWRTGFFADTTQAIKEEVRENGPSLLGVGAAAGTGGVVGAYLHGLWHDRNRGDAYSVSPYFDTKNVPLSVTMSEPEDVELMGDGGVACVSKSAAGGLRCTNVYEHIIKTFNVQSKQRLGERLFTKGDLDKQGGLTSANFPKTTTHEHFMAMAKHLGQPIIVFDSKVVNGVLPIRQIYPCVIYNDDVSHVFRRKLQEDGINKKNADIPICIAFDGQNKKYMRLEIPDPTKKQAIPLKLGVWRSA